MKNQILLKELLEHNKKLEPILCRSEYFEKGDLVMVEYDNVDLDEIFVYGKLWQLSNHLGYCNRVLNYLKKPISQEGILRTSKDSRNSYYWRIVDLDSRSDFEGKKAQIRR